MGVLFITGYLYAANENIDTYLGYLNTYDLGRIGDYTKGEMQLISNYNEIIDVQDKYYNTFIKKGLSPQDAEKCARVGVVEEDRFWIWLRDPITLPNGNTTAYNRFIPRNGLTGIPSVAVMAITDEKQVLVNVIFRHATREWEIELPRGGRNSDETTEQAALRELEEETGFKAAQAHKLTSIASDSGILTNLADIYLVKNLSQSEINIDECEAIQGCVFISKNLLKQAFVDGYMGLNINDTMIKAFCRDPFLATALLVFDTTETL